MIRAVLFDLDDTLIPEASAIQASLQAAARPFEERLSLPPGLLAEALEAVGKATFQSLDVSGIEARFGVTWEECLWGRVGPVSQAQIPALPALAQLLRSRVFVDALTACGIRSPLGPELEARFAAERRARLVPFAESAPLIAALRDRALLIGCATNGASEVQREKLVASRTSGWFDAVTVSGEVGIGKPDPTMLLRLCELLEVAPAEAIYVGNSLRRDVASAHAAGMRSVLIERFEPEEELRFPGGWPAQAGVVRPPLPAPDRTVFEVHGVLGLVDGWRARRAFRVFDQSRVPLAVDEPQAEDGRFVARVGAEGDDLRPAVRGATPLAAIEAGLRSLRARSAGRSFHFELGEPVDWDAVLR